MNDENLIPLPDRPKSEQRAIQVAGGVARGQQRRREKKMRDWLQIALTTVMTKKGGEVIMSPDTGEPLTREEAAIIKLTQQASNGDIHAIETIAKLLGEWVDKHEHTVNADISLKARTQAEAFRYIYNDYSPTYQRFFYDNRESRDVLLQGGRRSGKTQATIRHLLRLTAAMGEDLKILVATYQRPMLDNTIEDFTQITGIVPHADKAEIGRVLWQFKSYDEYTKAQGTQCDFLFINEAVNIPDDIANVLTQSVRCQVYYNYNPTQRSWVQSRITPDGHNLICTTFKDNIYLPQPQVEEFERLKERALRPNSTMRDRYMYQVYYLGNFATMVGAIFQNVERCNDYEQIPAREYFGLDFGFATDGDPTVLVGVKLYENKIYVKQYIYERGLVSDKELIKRMEACGLNDQCEIFADYGGQGRGRIVNLGTLGWSIYNAHKTERIDGISQMLTFDAVVIAGGNNETEREFQGLELLPPTAAGTQRTKGDDHAIDAARYAFQRAKYCELS